jgi:hypothetical protein
MPGHDELKVISEHGSLCPLGNLIAYRLVARANERKAVRQTRGTA